MDSDEEYDVDVETPRKPRKKYYMHRARKVAQKPGNV